MNNQRARVLLQPGYVLHRRAFRDSSLLVEVFTPQYGRVGLIARAARQVSSRLAGVIQPFRAMLVSWSGNGELPSLNAAEVEGGNHWLTGPALMGGFYLNELLMRLLHRHDPHPELYAAYHRGVEALGDICRRGEDEKRRSGGAVPRTEELEGILRIFEKHLLEEIGYGLVLEYDAENGQPIEAQQLYVYHLARGPVRISTAEAEMAPQRLTIRGQSLLNLAQGRLADPLSLREVKRLMRAALAEQLGGRPVNSRRLFTPSRTISEH